VGKRDSRGYAQGRGCAVLDRYYRLFDSRKERARRALFRYCGDGGTTWQAEPDGRAVRLLLLPKFGNIGQRMDKVFRRGLYRELFIVVRRD